MGISAQCPIEQPPSRIGGKAPLALALTLALALALALIRGLSPQPTILNYDGCPGRHEPGFGFGFLL